MSGIPTVRQRAVVAKKQSSAFNVEKRITDRILDSTGAMDLSNEAVHLFAKRQAIQIVISDPLTGIALVPEINVGQI